MAGIVSRSGYIPQYRMARKTIQSAMGWFNPGAMPGEKAVANYDEDSITMAVAAGMECLQDTDVKIDRLHFASTTAPYRERASAAIIATALDIGSDVQTTDFANSLRAGTSALLAACEAVKSGGASHVLVCGSDCRLGKAGSSQEMLFGDGAAALLVGNDRVIASLEGFYGVSYDFPDHWRADHDRFDRALEDRWIRDEGYNRFISEAISGLLRKTGKGAGDFARVIYPCLYPRDHAVIGKTLGFAPGQIQEPLLATVGETGTASSLMMLAAALEEAKAGDNILVASYGNGSEVLWFKVTPEIENCRAVGGLKKYLASRRELTSYLKYAAFRGLLPIESGIRGEIGPTYLPLAWRERRAIFGLVGSRCRRCGTPQYPPQRVCVNPRCRAIDEMESYRFAAKKGTLFSYTEDHLAFSMSPPEMYGVIDFEGGGRYNFDITDCETGSLKVGLPMAMTFRREYADEMRGIYGYRWKAMPAR